MRKLINILFLIFLVLTIIKVEYVTVPVKINGYTTEYRQEVKITFTDGVMQVPKDRILQSIIPLGEVEMIKNIEYNNEYYATYRFKKVKE